MLVKQKDVAPLVHDFYHELYRGQRGGLTDLWVLRVAGFVILGYTKHNNALQIRLCDGGNAAPFHVFAQE